MAMDQRWLACCSLPFCDPVHGVDLMNERRNVCILIMAVTMVIVAIGLLINA